MKPARAKAKTVAVPFEMPFEDHRQTKEIIRLQMQRIALAIQQGSELSEMVKLLEETKREVGKLKDKNMIQAFQKLASEIQGNWPIQTNTRWEHLELIGRIFAFIDQKTVY